MPVRPLRVLQLSLLAVMLSIAACGDDDDDNPVKPAADPMLGTWAGVLNSKDQYDNYYRDSLRVVITKATDYGIAYNMGTNATDAYPAVVQQIQDPKAKWYVLFYGDTLFFDGDRTGSRIQGTMTANIVGSWGTWTIDKVAPSP